MEKPPSDIPVENSPGIEGEKLLKPKSDLPSELLTHQEEMARFGNESSKKTQNPLDRAKKYLRILLAGAVLTVGGQVAYEKYDKYTEEQESIEYVLKSGLKEKAEKADFDLKVDVPNRKGPYILHIGNVHSFNANTPSAELMNILVHDVIVKSNQSSEQLLLSLKDKNSPEPVVFVEGYDEQSVEFLDFISTQRDIIMNLEISEQMVDKLVVIINNLPSKEKLPRDARTSVEYLVSKKLIELSKNNIQLNKEQFSILRNICEKKLESFDLQTIGERMIKEGAAMKLLIDEQYEIAPVESSAIREELKKAEGVLSSLADKLRQLSGLANKGSEEASLEYVKIALQYNQTNAVIHRETVLDARENFAVGLIKNVVSEQKTKHGIVPMLYGTSHDFSDNIKNANKSDGKGKVGLITLVPKTYKGLRE